MNDRIESSFQLMNGGLVHSDDPDKMLEAFTDNLRRGLRDHMRRYNMQQVVELCVQPQQEISDISFSYPISWKVELVTTGYKVWPEPPARSD